MPAADGAHQHKTMDLEAAKKRLAEQGTKPYILIGRGQSVIITHDQVTYIENRWMSAKTTYI